MLPLYHNLDNHYNQLFYCPRMKIFSLIIATILIISTLNISIPLHNGIYTNSGGYTITIQLGTPPQSFQVQVDTGSSKLAVSCINCNQCKSPPSPRFDYTRSSTYQNVSCDSGSFMCDDCGIKANGINSCLINTTYQDGGWLKGDIVSDLILLPGMAQGVRTSFGCINEESNDFASDQTIDGIWGIGKSSSDQNGDVVRMDQLIVAISNQQNSQRLVSLCLALLGGYLNIGSIDSSLHTQGGVVIPYDDSINDFISNSLSTISLGNAIISSSGPSDIPQLIIDSGSTHSVISENIYQKLTNQLNNICDQLGQNCIKQLSQKNIPCFNLSVFSDFSQFPPITFMFNDSPVNWYAEQYLNQIYNDEQYYCIAFSSSNQVGNYLLGDDFMLNKDIVFGESTITIYQQSKCSGQVVTYAYQQNNLQKVSSSAEIIPSKNTNSTNKTLMCIGLLALFVVFIFVVIFCFRRCEKANENNPQEKIISDGIETEGRFNQELAETERKASQIK